MTERTERDSGYIDALRELRLRLHTDMDEPHATRNRKDELHRVIGVLDELLAAKEGKVGELKTDGTLQGGG